MGTRQGRFRDVSVSSDMARVIINPRSELIGESNIFPFFRWVVSVALPKPILRSRTPPAFTPPALPPKDSGNPGSST